MGFCRSVGMGYRSDVPKPMVSYALRKVAEFTGIRRSTWVTRSARQIVDSDPDATGLIVKIWFWRSLGLLGPSQPDPFSALSVHLDGKTRALLSVGGDRRSQAWIPAVGEHSVRISGMGLARDRTDVTVYESTLTIDPSAVLYLSCVVPWLVPFARRRITRPPWELQMLREGSRNAR